MRNGQITNAGNGAMSTVPVELVGTSTNRARLQITIDAGVGYVIDKANAAAASGYIVTPEAPFVMDITTHGDMINHSWWGSADTDARRFGVIEILEIPR